MVYVSNKRLYLDQDGNVSEEPPASGTLLINEGGEMSDEDAAKYGLTDNKAKAEPPTNKAQSAPPENKSK